MYKVLSTKKLLPSLTELSKQQNIEIIEQDFISVTSLVSAEKCTEVLHLMQAGKEFAVFTSANAVIPFEQYLRQLKADDATGWKLFCLSGNTSNELSKAYAKRIGHIIATAENAKTLASKIIAGGVKEIIFFCGNRRLEELPDILKKAGVAVQEITVYETIETPVLTDNNMDGILFFSPSAVNSFFSMNRLKKNTVCFAIGKTTGDYLAGFTNNKIILSGSPSQEAMLTAVNCYFQNNTCHE